MSVILKQAVCYCVERCKELRAGKQQHHEVISAPRLQKPRNLSSPILSIQGFCTI